jgi:hypothetical protein
MKKSLFLKKLEKEAELQAQLHSRSFIPKQLNSLASLIGSHTWKALLILSGLTALIKTYLI